MRDVWRSAGLKGTGSNNIVVENAFVEEAYAIDAGAAMMGEHPGRVVSSHPLYTTGILSQFQFGLTTPLLAISDGLYSAFLDFFRDKQMALSPGKKSDNPLTQMRVGESAADLSAARLVLYNLNRKVMAGEMKAPGSGQLFMRDIGFIARLCQASADRLFTLSGARGLNEGNLFGRHWRDVHAICNHAALQADGYMQAYGALELTGTVPGAH
jgi:3-hydroxy-9,10-secoandrosta-1,3,5(10)-triene-9,17-dione monooxygenase